MTELQINGVIEDDSKIFFISQRDGSKDGSQNMLLGRNMANYFKIIPVTPSYLEH